MAQVPYEFLVRWNHLTGVYQGSHVKLYDNVTMREGDAQSVAIGAASGFPLSEVLTAIETGAIAAADEAILVKVTVESTLAVEQAAHAATKAELANVTAALAAAMARSV